MAEVCLRKQPCHVVLEHRWQHFEASTLLGTDKDSFQHKSWCIILLYIVYCIDGNLAISGRLQAAIFL
jgi:hypothetical protein